MTDIALTVAVMGALAAQHPLPPLDAQQVHCLAEAAFYEARGEGERGQRMVIDVVLNRVAHRAFPSTICAVVNQKGQFPFRRNPRLTRNKAGQEAWRTAVRLSALRLSDGLPSLTTATFFYRHSELPRWARRATHVAVVGGHTFVQRD
jgi:spore germination cell wall hydrolase CwlJ-like protein